MDRPVSSEEKLLKLIRKPAAPKDNKVQTEKNSKSQIDFLALSNKLLLILLLGLAVYVALDFFILDKKNKPQDALSTGSGVDEGTQGQSVIETVTDVKPFSNYQSEFERRNIFQYPWEKTDVSQPGQNNLPLVDLTSVIKISGIIVGDSPQVIVEDMKTHQTLFLSPGDSVQSAKVEEIKADRVIFNYNGNKVEMIP